VSSRYVQKINCRGRANESYENAVDGA